MERGQKSALVAVPNNTTSALAWQGEWQCEIDPTHPACTKSNIFADRATAAARPCPWPRPLANCLMCRFAVADAPTLTKRATV